MDFAPVEGFTARSSTFGCYCAPGLSIDRVRSSAYFTHRERRNRGIVNTETADGEQSAMVTVIG